MVLSRRRGTSSSVPPTSQPRNINPEPKNHDVADEPSKHARPCFETLHPTAWAEGPSTLAQAPLLHIWEFPKIRGTLLWDPYTKHPTI